MWAAAQIRAFGRVMGAESDVLVVTMIIIGAVVVIADTTIGGLMADAITDFIQGVAIIAGLIIIGFFGGEQTWWDRSRPGVGAGRTAELG